MQSEINLDSMVVADSFELPDISDDDDVDMTVTSGGRSAVAGRSLRAASTANPAVTVALPLY